MALPSYTQTRILYRINRRMSYNFFRNHNNTVDILETSFIAQYNVHEPHVEELVKFVVYKMPLRLNYYFLVLTAFIRLRTRVAEISTTELR